MNSKEYNALVDSHSDGLYRFLLSNIRNAETAKDLVQTAFEKVWVLREEINSEKAKSFLFKTGYNAMIDWIRREKVRATEEITDFDHPKDFNQYSDLQQVLHEALSKLPEVQRTVVLLRDYEGYDYNEIAEISNISLSQVKVYIFRARKALKQYIGKMEVVL